MQKRIRRNIRIPDFIEQGGFGGKTVMQAGFECLMAGSTPGIGFSWIDAASNTDVTGPLMFERAQVLAGGAGGELSQDVIGCAASGPEYFAGFESVVGHFGGVEGVSGKRVVDLGGGKRIGPIMPVATLSRLGAEVAVVDECFLRTEGLFVKSDIRDFLRGLPNGSVDAFLAFATLEGGSGDTELYRRMFESVMRHVNDPETEAAFIAYFRQQRALRPDDSEAAEFLDGIITAKPGAGGKSFREVYDNSVESEGYLDEVYALMRDKLAPDGVAVVLNRLDDKGFREPELERHGFKVDRVGHLIGHPPGKMMVRVIKLVH